jgi:hypothetical protein
MCGNLVILLPLRHILSSLPDVHLQKRSIVTHKGSTPFTLHRTELRIRGFSVSQIREIVLTAGDVSLQIPGRSKKYDFLRGTRPWSPGPLGYVIEPVDNLP